MNKKKRKNKKKLKGRKLRKSGKKRLKKLKRRSKRGLLKKRDSVLSLILLSSSRNHLQLRLLLRSSWHLRTKTIRKLLMP